MSAYRGRARYIFGKGKGTRTVIWFSDRRIGPWSLQYQTIYGIIEQAGTFKMLNPVLRIRTRLDSNHFPVSGTFASVLIGIRAGQVIIFSFLNMISFQKFCWKKNSFCIKNGLLPCVPTNEKNLLIYFIRSDPNPIHHGPDQRLNSGLLKLIEVCWSLEKREWIDCLKSMQN